MLKDIGTILVEQKSISHQELLDFLKASEAENKTLAQYLEEKKLVKSEEIAKAYAKQLSIPFIDKITEEIADPELLGKIPFKFLRENVVIPVKLKGKIAIITSNPNNFRPIDELNILLEGNVQLAVATEATIIEGINRFYPIEGTKKMFEELGEEKELGEEAIELGEIEEKDILAMAQEAPIIKLVNHIIFQAVKRGASDIHIEPFEKEVRVRYRIDGVLHEVFSPPKRIQAALASRIKIMANLNIAEKRMPQDGRIEIRVADKPIELRTSVLPTVYGEKIVMRLLDKSRTFGQLSSIGLDKRDYDVIEHSMHQPNGIILLTGPTGSGKTSTLYSILSELNKPDVNIVTVEDPVEYQMNGVSQVQVNDKIGRTFAIALRSILRQDPDIIMIGEIRDQETAQIAIQSSLTGHLVLSTIHTNNAPATITRLIDMGLEPFLISSTITCVVAQRLVRKLCEKCKKPYQPSLDVLQSIGMTEKEAKDITFYEAVGCHECSETGYKGRIAIFEVMEMTPGIAELTKERADAQVIRQQAVKDGMTLLVQDGIKKIKKGLTTIDEVLSVAIGLEGSE
jgi:general secretion pathway protein E